MAAYVYGGDQAGHAQHLLDVVVPDDPVIDARFDSARFKRLDDDESNNVVKAEYAVRAVCDKLIDQFPELTFSDIKDLRGSGARLGNGARTLSDGQDRP